MSQAHRESQGFSSTRLSRGYALSPSPWHAHDSQRCRKALRPYQKGNLYPPCTFRYPDSSSFLIFSRASSYYLFPPAETNNMTKLWKKSGTKTNPDIEKYTAGTDYLFDRVLMPFDIAASRAHAKGLEKANILSKGELKKILNALQD